MNQTKKIITISGKLGSGKSSTAKLLAEKLGFKHFSSGDFLRIVAQERSLSIHQLMKEAETDSSIDFEIDALLRSKRNDDALVIDSRLAFHWIPNSFKVFLDINTDIAAERIFQDLKNNPLRRVSEDALSLSEMKKNMIQRYTSDIKRYQKLYNIDYTHPDNFDLIIDTGDISNPKEVVVQKIIVAAKEYFKCSSF